jgi:hypothetical protein
MNTRTLDLSSPAAMRDWTIAKQFLPYALAFDPHGHGLVEIISMPWWENGTVHVMVRKPGDPLSLREIEDAQEWLKPTVTGVLDGDMWHLERNRRWMPADIGTYAFTRGWTVEDTGGGCTALHQGDGENPRGYWWLTDDDGGMVPQHWGRCYLGRYDAHGNQVEGWRFESLQQAMDAVGEVYVFGEPRNGEVH